MFGLYVSPKTTFIREAGILATFPATLKWFDVRNTGRDKSVKLVGQESLKRSGAHHVCLSKAFGLADWLLE